MEKNKKVALILSEEGTTIAKVKNVDRIQYGLETGTLVIQDGETQSRDSVKAIVPASLLVVLTEEQESENPKPTSFEWALALMRKGNTMVCGDSEFRIEEGNFLQYINNKWVQSAISSEMLCSRSWHFPHYKG